MTAISPAAPKWHAVSDDPRDPVSRLCQLLDDGSVYLRRCERGERVAIAEGRINGSPVVAYCTDATSSGGAMGYAGCREIAAAIDLAAGSGRPVIGIWHCSGASLAEGMRALDGVGEVFAAMIRASGRVPQISVIVGPAAGGA
ncbi:MAG: acyl-CoA carboxylase subunit beta, partial [Frankiaceae bacterium]|nr:acyl-CoA carboxylase subunit beta [Frankiaceae bacterium]